ncbi:MAG: tryptophan synthase subunit alpha, partial [Acidimicrobiia bacterium]
MNRLEERLADRRPGLAPYVTAGDGGLDTTLAVLRALDRAGVTCVELGVPFSDPVADGPVLQAATARALAEGTTLDGVLSVVAGFRRGGRGAAGSDLPVAIFSYANPLLRRGWRRSCELIAAAGADALIVPDLPVEES